MASVVGVTNNGDITFDIDYSLKDGRVRQFIRHGKTLFDEDEGVETESWAEKLYVLILEKNFDIDKGHGLSAYVYTMMKRFQPDRYKELYGE